MVALADPRDVSNLHPHNALRYMRLKIALPPGPPRTPLADDDEPSEIHAWSVRGLGRGYRPIPLDVARAWSEAW